MQDGHRHRVDMDSMGKPAAAAPAEDPKKTLKLVVAVALLVVAGVLVYFNLLSGPSRSASGDNTVVTLGGDAKPGATPTTTTVSGGGEGEIEATPEPVEMPKGASTHPGAPSDPDESQPEPPSPGGGD